MRILLKILVFIFAFAFAGKGQIYIKPNNTYGQIWNRIRPDSTLWVPTGCGVPVGTASLRSSNQHMAALYFDSCGHKVYYFDPSDSSWIDIGSGGVTSLKNKGTGYRILVQPDSLRTLVKAGTWAFLDTTGTEEIRIGVDPQVGWGLGLTGLDAIYVDTGTNKVATQYYARSQITGVPASRSSYNTDKLNQGQAYVYNWSDSAFYPDLIAKFKLSIPRGSGLITFGNSIASPSTNPPTDSMHSTILARNIGGPDSNFAVGGTNIHDALTRINQGGKLPRDRTQAMLWQPGIDCREDTNVYADRAVIYAARVAAARAFYRDTLVLTGGMTLNGTWSNYNAGLAAGSISNGKYTTTSGDYFEFAANGKNAFFTFFSESPIDNPTNFTDSVQVNVDGVYYGSYDMSNIGIASGGKYLCAIIIQNMSNAAHNIRVFNRRSDTMAIDFAGSLKDVVDCYPVMCELLLPVGSGYIGGSGAIKKLRFNRLNNEYTKDVYYQWQKFGYPIITVDPRNGLDMNSAAHTLDFLHPTSAGQGLMFKSIWPQINVYSIPGGTPSWSLPGNAGTTPGTNFIGTTDAQSLIIKTNNVVRGKFDVNNNVVFMQYQDIDASASNSLLSGAGSLGPSALFASALNRARANAQDAFAAGGPGCEANGLLAFATGASKVNGQRGFGLINSVVEGDNGGALGYGAYCGSFFHIDLGYGSDTTGSYLWSKNSIVATDPIFTVGGARATDGIGGIVGRRTVLRINKNGAGYLDTSFHYNPGKVSVTTTAADSLLIPDVAIVRKIVSDSITAAAGADGNGIYGGSGSLPSDVTVTGGNNSITFSDLFAHRIYSDFNVYAKANGTGTHTAAVIGNGNIYQIGYTPVEGIYSKGAGLYIDTNNNVGLGVNPPTTMPLYTTGASTYVQGFQSNGGNFYRVSTITADQTLNATYYFVLIDASSNNVTITLPGASTVFGSSVGIFYRFQRIDNSGNTVTIQRAGSDTINGANSFTLTTQYSIKYVQCTSTSTWAQGTD